MHSHYFSRQSINTPVRINEYLKKLHIIIITIMMSNVFRDPPEYSRYAVIYEQYMENMCIAH